MITGYRVAPLRHSDIETAAVHVRRAFNIDPLFPIPGWELFERARQIEVQVAGRRVDVSYGVEETLPNAALACAIYDEGAKQISLILSAESYDDLERRNGYRARFSVAHEIGHAKMHADHLVQLPRINHRRRAMLRTDVARTPVFRDSEWQANMFAAALLMPAPGLEFLSLRGTLSPRALQKMYRVSETSAAHRLRTFDRNRNNILEAWAN